MNSVTRLSLFVCILSFLTFQMTCNDVVIGDTGNDPEVVSAACIDKSKIDKTKGCPRNYDPVCGCDGKKYSNTCEAEKAGVTRWTKGECPCIVESLKKPDAPCTKEYMPVCGCDNQTYSNECMAKNAGLTNWKPGKCEDASSCIDRNKIDPDAACAKIYKPVCGCDGKTYGNECEAEKAGVTKWEAGKCN